MAHSFFRDKTLQALDRYAEEFGGLIVRFLKLVFMSVLWSRNNVGAREAIGPENCSALFAGLTKFGGNRGVIAIGGRATQFDRGALGGWPSIQR
jgi:hypothetical protein